MKVTASSPLLKVAEFHLRTPRFGAAVAAHGDYLYILGGSSADDWVLDTIERLDVRTGVTEPFGRLQRGRLWHRVVSVGMNLLVLGGDTVFAGTNGRMTLRTEDSVERIDLATGRATFGPPLPQPRRSFACSTAGGYVFVFGGYWRADNQAGWSNAAWRLDLATLRWEVLPPKPTPCEAEAALVHGPLFLLPGGFDGVKAIREVEMFNPRDNTWRTLPALCRPASAHAVAFLGHHLFLFGHYDDIGQCLAYDLRTRQSEVIAAPFTGARHAAAVVHRDRIYIVGGRTADSSVGLDLVQVFALRSSR